MTVRGIVTVQFGALRTHGARQRTAARTVQNRAGVAEQHSSGRLEFERSV